MSYVRPATSPLFPRTALHPAALAWADGHANDGAPWCIAFSGGADSLALLLALCAHFPERRANGKFVALHFNHHLRGAASDGDELFCREMCAALDVELRVGHWQREGGSASPVADISEADARETRHAFFAREMSALGAKALFLGHQRDDVAETMLMRLARGSSAAGLAAPRPVHLHADGRVFLRPLLTLSKKQITDALAARGLAWREDATNTAPVGDPSGDFFRNRIRRDVLPAFIAASQNNDALAGAALTRDLLEEDAAALDCWLDEILPAPAITPDSLDLRALAGKPRALLRRALRRWPPAAELARAGFEALLEMCVEGEGRTSIGNAVALFENGILRIEAAASLALQKAFNYSHVPPFDLALPDGATLKAEIVTLTDELRAGILAGHCDPIHTLFIAPPPPKTPLIIRSWEPGDRYQPLGAPGSAKVSDLFINRKIPHGRRFALPVVCIVRDGAGELVWIPGFPPADAWKIDAQTPQALHLTYHCGTCTVHAQSLLQSPKQRNVR